MSLRLIALLVAAVLTVPASVALLRPRRSAEGPADESARRPLDAIWAVVPVILLIALATLSILA
jgi:heme/copper-type cytochrome/quinol oxidase subunit 2